MCERHCIIVNERLEDGRLHKRDRLKRNEAFKEALGWFPKDLVKLMTKQYIDVELSQISIEFDNAKQFQFGGLWIPIKVTNPFSSNLFQELLIQTPIMFAPFGIVNDATNYSCLPKYSLWI